MVNLKRIVEDFFLVVLILLNILDFFEYNVLGYIGIDYLAPDLDFLKKIISWALMIYLLYHFGFTRILIGYKNRLIDTLLLISYTLFIVKDLFFYLLYVQLEFFKSVAVVLQNYQSEIVFFSFNISSAIMLFLAFYISRKTKIEKESMLGAFSVQERGRTIKFFVSLLSISFVAYFIFNIAFQWFTIVIDAPIVMIALVYYFFAATKYHGVGSALHRIGSLGDKILQKFISFFHSRYTIPLGLISLLVLHFFTDMFVFIVPTFIKLKDALYYNVLVDAANMTIFQLFVQNARGLDLYGIINLGIIYISNLGFITTLFIAPVLIIRGIYTKTKIEFHPLDKLVILPAFLLYFLFPVYKIKSYNSLLSGISGVNITISAVKHTVLSNFALLIFLVIVFVLLLVYKFTKFNMTSVSLILIFIPMIDYVSKYFSSTVYYYVELIRKVLHFENILILLFLFIFLLLIVLFYWTSIALFVYESFKVNFFDKLAEKINTKNVDAYTRFMNNTHNFAMFMVFALIIYLLTYYVSTVFVIFRLSIQDFLIPIILTLILISLPRINKFFVSVDFGISIKNVFLFPLSALAGAISGAAFVYFREPLVYTSKSVVMVLIFLVFVAISEEVLFRHYLQSYAARIMSFKLAMLFQSGLFALLHLTKGVNLSALLSIFGFGIIMTLIKEKAGLTNAIVSHFAANIILYYFFLW